MKLLARHDGADRGRHRLDADLSGDLAERHVPARSCRTARASATAATKPTPNATKASSASSVRVVRLLEAGIVGKPEQERQRQRDEDGEARAAHREAELPHLHRHQERKGEEDSAAESARDAGDEIERDLAPRFFSGVELMARTPSPKREKHEARCKFPSRLINRRISRSAFPLRRSRSLRTFNSSSSSTKFGAVARRDAAELVVEPQERGRRERGHAQAPSAGRRRDAATALRTAVAMSRSEPASVPSAVVSRPSAPEDRAARAARSSVRSVPTDGMASVTSIIRSVALRGERHAQRRRRHVVHVDDQPAPGLRGRRAPRRPDPARGPPAAAWR